MSASKKSPPTSKNEFSESIRATELIASNGIKIYQIELQLAEKIFILENLEAATSASKIKLEQALKAQDEVEMQCRKQGDRWNEKQQSTKECGDRKCDKALEFLNVRSRWKRRGVQIEHGKLVKLQGVLKEHQLRVSEVKSASGNVEAEFKTIQNEGSQLQARIQLLKKGNAQAKTKMMNLWAKKGETEMRLRNTILTLEKSNANEKKSVITLNAIHRENDIQARVSIGLLNRFRAELHVIRPLAQSFLEIRNRELEQSFLRGNRSDVIIRTGNRAAHDGNAEADALLYCKSFEWQAHQRNDVTEFTRLYGFAPAVALQFKGFEKFIELLNLRYVVTNSKRVTPENFASNGLAAFDYEAFEKLFREFMSKSVGRGIKNDGELNKHPEAVAIYMSAKAMGSLASGRYNVYRKQTGLWRQ